MAQHSDCYTYRGGEKLALVKRPNQFVTRALPDTLAGAGLPQGEQMSSASTRITCPAEQLEGLMARARGFAVTHHAYDEAESGSEFLITDRVFVTFKDSLSAEDLAAFAGEHGLLQLEAYDDKNFLFQLTDATGMNPVKLVVKLTEGDARVAAAENDLNHRVATASLTLPLDPRYREQWHLHTHFTHPEVDPRSSSLCEAAWETLDSYGDPETVVGVTDDGCRLDHRDFDSPQKFAAWGYFEGTRLVTDGDIDAEPDKMYEAGANHGTSCAGVSAGEVDGLLTVGAAPGCRLLPIKWESNGPFLLLNDSKLLTAINFLADKIDVMSNSWGQVPTQIFATPVVNRIRQLSTSGGRRNRGIVF
ncbi:MAG: S8 family serine peptidase, partial [Kiloniellales bacterium]|nr:S8 family serine peptidase [Kiloniellales bacterium]